MEGRELLRRSVLLLLFCVRGRGLAVPPAMRVLAETERLLVVDKPAGMPFHSLPGDPEDGVDAAGEATSGVLRTLRAMQHRGDVGYQGPLYSVHRLDTVTSGVLVVAKDRDAAGKVARALQRRERDQLTGSSSLVDKFYIALMRTKPKKKMGVIRGDMAKARRGVWKLQRTLEDPAVTRFASLGTLPPRGRSSAAGSLRAVLLKPETGRTHQLRVALRSLGAPILGDPVYESTSSTPQDLEVDRCYLHACALRLDLRQLDLGTTAAGHSDLQVLCPPTTGLHWEPLDDLPNLFDGEANADSSGFHQAIWPSAERHIHLPEPDSGTDPSVLLLAAFQRRCS